MYSRVPRVSGEIKRLYIKTLYGFAGARDFHTLEAQNGSSIE